MKRFQGIDKIGRRRDYYGMKNYVAPSYELWPVMTYENLTDENERNYVLSPWNSVYNILLRLFFFSCTFFHGSTLLLVLVFISNFRLLRETTARFVSLLFESRVSLFLFCWCSKSIPIRARVATFNSFVRSRLPSQSKYVQWFYVFELEKWIDKVHVGKASSDLQ